VSGAPTAFELGPGDADPEGGDLRALDDLLAARRIALARFSPDLGSGPCSTTADAALPPCEHGLHPSAPSFGPLLEVYERISRQPAGAPAGGAVAEARAVRALARWQAAAGTSGPELERVVRELGTLAKAPWPPESAVPAGELAALLVDLAALRLVRAERDGDLRDVVAALDAAVQALELSPRSPAGRFDYAVALGRLGLRSEEAVAWGHYLEIDATSPWSEWARVRLRRLDQPSPSQGWEGMAARLGDCAARVDERTVRAAVERHRSEVRLLVEDHLLPAWGAAEIAGDSQTSQGCLERLVALANALGEVSGDRHLAGVVDGIGRSPREQRAALAQGFVTWGQARFAYERQDHEAARGEFARARDLLREVGSPFADWSAFYLAVCEYHVPRYAEALAGFSLVEAAQPAGPSVLRGYARWMQGQALVETARYGEALQAFVEARRELAALGELQLEAAMHTLASRVLDSLGDDAGAWRERAAAIARFPYLTKDRRISNLLSAIADGAERLGYPRAAGAVRREQVRQAERSGNALLLAIALQQEARSQLLLGDHAAAHRALGEARRALGGIAGAGVRERVETNLWLTEAELVAVRDPRAALRALGEARRILERGQVGHFSITLERQTASALQRLGDGVAAERAMAAAQALVEPALAAIRPSEALALAAELRKLHDLQLEIGLAAHGPRPEGLLLAERARALELRAQAAAWTRPGLPTVEAGPTTADGRQVERWSGGEWPDLEPPGSAAAVDGRSLASSGSGALQALVDALPARTAALVFRQLPEALLVWRVDPHREPAVRAAVVRRPAEALAEEIAAVVAAVREGRTLEQLAPSLTELSASLFGPGLELGEHVERLLLVPDAALTGLPFALLAADPGGPLLVERFELVSSPSLALALAGATRAARSRPPTSVLAIGDPRNGSANLPAVPDAAEEALRVARLYEEAAVLLGSAATAEALRRDLPAHAVLHFAGHALLESDWSSHPHLVLAHEGHTPGGGLLFAEQLGELVGPPLQLVVLSACSTAPDPRRTGFSSLLLVLLARGVPDVVASQWPIEDRSAGALMERFHRQVRAGASPPAALRRAQIEALQDVDPGRRVPAVWAAFTVVSGAAGASNSLAPGKEER
jgi:CHAT domain-containing protein/tetratricopeptide (TPR) repeat protein